MLEKPPVNEDSLNDGTGRVNDINAAREMAELEGFYREIDKDRIFAPGKKDRVEREVALNDAGLKALEAKRQREAEEAASAGRRQRENREYDAFIRRNLDESGLSEHDWTVIPVGERVRLERIWRRREQRSRNGY